MILDRRRGVDRADGAEATTAGAVKVILGGGETMRIEDAPRVMTTTTTEDVRMGKCAM
jgi:hypothetical protein